MTEKKRKKKPTKADLQARIEELEKENRKLRRYAPKPVKKMVPKTIGWLDLDPPARRLVTQIADYTGMRPIVKKITPQRWECTFYFMHGSPPPIRAEWAIDGLDLMELLRRGLARVKLDHRSGA